jgi:hypothetical protein
MSGIELKGMGDEEISWKKEGRWALLSNMVSKERRKRDWKEKGGK